MKSKASFKSHPLHPMLVAFPVTFFITAFILSAAGIFYEDTYWTDIGRLSALTGVISALVAAIPGLIDYIYVVPPESSAKKRATYHMAVNLAGTGIFVAAFLLHDEGRIPDTLIILLHLAGLLLITAGGWMGGTLVYRNQIGVDHRYAHAGKWKELTINTKDKAVNLGDLRDLRVNQMRLALINGKRIVLARTESGLVAFDDRCSHKGGSLAGGTMICATVACPWHGSQFNTNSGDVAAGPAEHKIATYKVSEQLGQAVLKLE